MNFRILMMGSALVSVLSLGACDYIIYGGDSQLSQTRPAIKSDRFTSDVETGSLSDGQMMTLARDYWSNGSGPMMISVTYDPQSKTNTAKKASDEAARLSASLKARGVKDVQAGTAPVPQSGALSRTAISYVSLGAAASKDCNETLSMKFADDDYNPDYKFGCTIETYTARQVARPADLAGSDDMDNNSGRRDSNIIRKGYQTGETFEELKGTNASESSH